MFKKTGGKERGKGREGEREEGRVKSREGER